MTRSTETPLTEALARYMRDHGMTYTTLAALVRSRGGAVSSQGAWQWATGRTQPSERNRRALAKLLEVSSDDVLLMARGFEPTSEVADG